MLSDRLKINTGSTLSSRLGQTMTQKSPVQTIKDVMRPIQETGRAIAQESKPPIKSLDEIQDEIRAIQAKRDKTAEDIERSKSLAQEFYAKQAENKRFGQGFASGVTAGIVPKITEQLYTPETKERIESAKSGLGYGAGSLLGTAALIGGAYGALGGAVAGPSATTSGGVGGATGTLAPTLSQRLATYLGTGTAGALTTELAKDIAIGAPIAAVQSATSGRDMKKELAENLLIDLAMGAGISGASEIFKFVKTLKGTKQATEVAEQFAKQTDVPIEEATKVIDDVISADTLKTVRTTTPQIEPRMVGREVGEIQPRILEAEIEPRTMASAIEEPSLTIGPRVEPTVRPLDSIASRIEEPSIRVEPTFKQADEMASVVSDAKPVQTLEDVIVRAPNLKDVGAGERWTKDFDRITEKVFGKGTPEAKIVKETIYNPFDKSKGNYARDVVQNSDELFDTIVKGYDIKPKSKESAFVMRFGEGRMEFDELVKEVGEKRATELAEATQWFRNKYDTLLDQINVSRAKMGKEAIPKREDYFRHFNEFTNQFKEIAEMLQNPTNIDPKLAGISEWTKPTEKWRSIFQRRTDGRKFTEDAVSGMLNYLPAAEYAIHIDPHIGTFRDFARNLAESTQGTRNVNNYIKYLEDFANDIAGKTNMWDRPFMERIGRNNWTILNALNNRVKKNTVLGNVSSSISQILNVPNGLADVKDPVAIAKGFEDYVKSWNNRGHKELYQKSDFLSERFMNDAQSKFKMKLTEQPEKFAVWMLGALDEVGSKLIWSMEYEKAVKEGIENAVKYADDQTRKMVAGRGIGEVPLWQKSKVAGLVMPFTVEVNNSLNVVKDMVKEKDLAGMAILAGASWLMNSTIEPITGQRPLPDPIDAVASGAMKEGTFGDKVLSATGSLAGEAISALPGGQFAASIVPKFGVTTGIQAPEFVKTALPSLVGEQGTISLPGREELFGGNDPSRFMTGGAIPAVKGLTDPLRYLLPSFGGNQLAKTMQGAQSVGLLPQKISTGETLEYENVPASVSKGGRIRTFTEPNPLTTAQALAFGQYSTPNVREFFDESRTAYGTKQTANLLQLVGEGGFDPSKLDQAITKIRDAGLTTKDARLKSLKDSGYTDSEIQEIGRVMYGYAD